jgi:Ca-activated chloride channel family protein
MIEDFHFIRPILLLLLPVGFAMAYLLWNHSGSNSNWSRVCDEHLLPHLLSGKRTGRRQLPTLLFLLAWTMATVSVAGPAWQRLPQPVHDTLLGRVLVFDLSLSMKSTDLSPDRLSRARFKLMDLIRSGTGIQQGLVVFAGDAFVVVPVTDDIDTLANLVPSLDTRTVPVQGSRTDLGIHSAVTLLENTGFQTGTIILITDGVSEGTSEAAARAASRGFTVSVLAVGTAAGAPVPLNQGILLKDPAGNIVIPGVDHMLLRRIASRGGGKYSALTADDADIRLLSERSSMELNLSNNSGQRLADEYQTDEYQTDRWIDRGPWVLVALLVLAVSGFRRGWILLVCCVLVPATAPRDALAFGWDDLWLRNDQQAARLFRDQEFDRIEENAPPQWLGASRYRSGDFDGATESFLQGDPGKAASHYNAGNAMARSFALQQALLAYDRALELDPQMTEARENRDLVERLLEQQQKQQSQDSENSDSAEDQQKSEQEQARSGAEYDQQGDTSDDEKEQASRETRKNSDSSRTEQAGADQNLEDRENADDESLGSNTTQEIDLATRTMDEKQQALEQWLKRIPDDPGGLLRRKFARQYSLRDTPRSAQQW